MHIRGGDRGISHGRRLESSSIERKWIYVESSLVLTDPGFIESVGTGGSQDFEFRQGIIRRDEPIEQRDKMAGGALRTSQEKVGAPFLSCGEKAVGSTVHVAIENSAHRMKGPDVGGDGFGEFPGV